MILRYRVLIFLFLALWGIGAFDYAEPEDFPFLVPVAPEVDNGGPQIRGPGKSNNNEIKGPRITPLTPEAIKNFDFAPPTHGYEAPVPSKPPSTKQGTPPRSQSRPAADRDAPPPNRGPRQQGTPAQQPNRVDCSQYPAMIANARSEAEMQITARYYLTCLLQNGWPMENAKAQVIQTVEAVTRANR